jgi:competence protein ComEC
LSHNWHDMTGLHKYPFLRMLIPLVIGIWVAIQLPQLYWSSLAWIAAGMGLIIMLAAHFLVRSYSLRWLFGFGLSLFLFVFGVLYTDYCKATNNANHLLNAGKDYSYYLVRINEPPQLRETTLKLSTDLVVAWDSVESGRHQARILIYLQRNTESDQLKYGNLILFAKPPGEVPPAKNPYQFNYKQHLANKGIHHQVFLKENEWQFAGQGYNNPLYHVAYGMRDYLLHALEKNGLKGDEFAVASAILLGYDDNLPQYLRKGYAAAGAMHVLCVSGLHVGIVFILLNFLLGFMKKTPGQQTTKTLLLIFAIWFYAMLTGLAPSVNRASIMLSFVLLGTLLNRKGNIINSLAASALLLLVANPFTLLHIGFQLSYTAVLGIVLFQKPIHHLFYFKNKYIDQVWEITALSFAAQLGTTPLAVYYFNQFPVYFWLSNLFLVPLSFAVIVAGMSLLVLNFVPYLSKLLGVASAGLLYLLNAIIQWIERLPMSTLQGLYLNRTETLLLYIIISLILLMMHNNTRRFIMPTMLVMLMLFSSFGNRTYENNKALKLVIYSVPNHSVYSFIQGKEHVLLADSTLMQNEFIIGFNLKGHWTRAGLSHNPYRFGMDEDVSNHPFIYKKRHKIVFGNSSIAIWDGQNPCQPSDNPFQVNLMIITGNIRENLQHLLSCYEFNQLVIDPTVPPWQLRAWANALQKAAMPFHDVRNQGAYMLELGNSY